MQKKNLLCSKSANRLFVSKIVKNVTQLENVVFVIFIVLTILTKLETIKPVYTKQNPFGVMADLHRIS